MCKDSKSLCTAVTLLKLDHITIYSNRISKFTECKRSCLKYVHKHKQFLLFTLASSEKRCLHSFVQLNGQTDISMSNPVGCCSCKRISYATSQHCQSVTIWSLWCLACGSHYDPYSSLLGFPYENYPLLKVAWQCLMAVTKNRPIFVF